MTKGGPADSAGIQAGDVLTDVGGHRITTPDDVASAIEGRAPGDDIEVQVVRPDGSRDTVIVHLGRRPAHTP